MWIYKRVEDENVDKSGPRESEETGMNNLDTCMSRYQCALPEKYQMLVWFQPDFIYYMPKLLGCWKSRKKSYEEETKEDKKENFEDETIGSLMEETL